jgi:hypothetical protein
MIGASTKRTTKGLIIMTNESRGGYREPWETIIVEGTIIAWGGLCDGKGGNAKCRREHRENRTYHIIPSHHDPRAQDCYIALPTHHAASRDDAIEMLQRAWETTVSVDNARDRDAAYARKIPFRIMKGGRY